MRIGKIESMETWNYGRCEQYLIGKYQENWKYEKYGKYELGKYQENWKYGNLKNMKDVNRNKGEAL